MLKGLPRPVFTYEVAWFLCRLDSIHPFREGNGRSQVRFVVQLAKEAGHELDFTVASRQRMVEASIEAHKGHIGGMTRLMEEISNPTRVAALSKAISFLDENRYDSRKLASACSGPGR